MARAAGCAERRRVLFVHPSDEAYGADRVLLQLVRSLAGRGVAVSVLLPDDVPEGWLSARLGEVGIPVAHASLAPARRRYLRPWRILGYLRSLRRARDAIDRAADAFGATIIHVNTSALLVAPLLRRPGRRVVWHIHEIIVAPRLAAWVFQTLPRRGADLVVAISAAVASHLRPGRAPVVIVPNGIPPDVAAEPLAPPGRPLVLFVGRLNRWKGAEVLVDAIAVLAREGVAAHTAIVGAPPIGEEWRAAALRKRAAPVEDRVTFVGFTESTAAWHAAADIVVVPSTWPEPFGIVTLEAMRAGRAIVASAVGASPELLDHGSCGLLVPPGDADALASALRHLLGDAEARRRLGDAARRRFLARFTEDRFVDAIERAYRRVDGGR